MLGLVALGIALGLWGPRGVPPVAHDGLQIFLLPTEPYVLIPAVAVIAAGCAWRRRWAGLALCLLGSIVPVVLTTWVLKPLFDRPLHDYLAYPSGHMVSLVSVLTVLVLLVRRALVVAPALAVIAGIGLVRAGYHYPVDVVGGACFAVAIVLTIGWGLCQLRDTRTRSACATRRSR